MRRLPPRWRADPRSETLRVRNEEAGTRLVEIVTPSDRTQQEVTTRSDALIRMAEAEDALRAIGAGEVDAFVVSDGGPGRRVFTLSTADRPHRVFGENMRDGAATLSSDGVILYANRRLAELLLSATETIVGSPLADFVAGDATELDKI